MTMTKMNSDIVIKDQVTRKSGVQASYCVADDFEADPAPQSRATVTNIAWWVFAWKKVPNTSMTKWNVSRKGRRLRMVIFGSSTMLVSSMVILNLLSFLLAEFPHEIRIFATHNVDQVNEDAEDIRAAYQRSHTFTLRRDENSYRGTISCTNRQNYEEASVTEDVFSREGFHGGSSNIIEDHSMNFRPRDILVVGGASFVGMHLCLALAQQGHSIYVYDTLNDDGATASSSSGRRALSRNSLLRRHRLLQLLQYGKYKATRSPIRFFHHKQDGTSCHRQTFESILRRRRIRMVIYLATDSNALSLDLVDREGKDNTTLTRANRPYLDPCFLKVLESVHFHTLKLNMQVALEKRNEVNRVKIQILRNTGSNWTKSRDAVADEIALNMTDSTKYGRRVIPVLYSSGNNFLLRQYEDPLYGPNVIEYESSAKLKKARRDSTYDGSLGRYNKSNTSYCWTTGNEELASYASQKYGVPTIGLRYDSDAIYGPWMPWDGAKIIFNKYLKSHTDSQTSVYDHWGEIDVVGKSEDSYGKEEDHVYIDDVISKILRSAKLASTRSAAVSKSSPIQLPPTDSPTRLAESIVAANVLPLIVNLNMRQTQLSNASSSTKEKRNRKVTLSSVETTLSAQSSDSRLSLPVRLSSFQRNDEGAAPLHMKCLPDFPPEVSIAEGMHHFARWYQAYNDPSRIYSEESSMSKSVLVLGGAGFIGMHAALKLSKMQQARNGSRTEDDDYVKKVVAYDNLNGDLYASQLKYERRQLLLRNGIPFVQGDVCNATLLLSTMLEHDINTVLYLAAQSILRVDGSVKDQFQYPSNNVDCFATLLNVLKEKPGESIHLVHVLEDDDSRKSTAHLEVKHDSIYVKQNMTISHEVGLRSTTEELALAHHNLHGIRYFAVKIRDVVYGPFGRPDAMYYGLASLLANGENDIFESLGREATTESYLYVSDAVDIIIGAVFAREKVNGSQTIDISPTNRASFAEVLRILQIIMRKPEQGVNAFAMNGTKSEKLKAWKGSDTNSSTTTLEIGMRTFAEWFVEYSGASFKVNKNILSSQEVGAAQDLTRDNADEICFTTAFFTESQTRERNIIEKSSVSHLNHGSPLRYFFFTNAHDLQVNGWERIVLNDLPYRRLITQSRWPKFMGWQHPELRKCRIIFYSDSNLPPRKLPMHIWLNLTKKVLSSEFGIMQEERGIKESVTEELYALIRNKKDLARNVDASLEWLLEQPDFNDNALGFWNMALVYDPRNNNFRELASTFWAQYSKEVMSWRDQPLWRYSVDKLGVKPEMFPNPNGESKAHLQFWGPKLSGTKKLHKYNDKDEGI